MFLCWFTCFECQQPKHRDFLFCNLEKKTSLSAGKRLWFIDSFLHSLFSSLHFSLLSLRFSSLPYSISPTFNSSIYLVDSTSHSLWFLSTGQTKARVPSAVINPPFYTFPVFSFVLSLSRSRRKRRPMNSS